jgi:hypothetical protein
MHFGKRKVYAQTVDGKHYIDSSLSEDEQAISIIHEIVHGYPKYKGKSTIVNPNFKIEDEIDKEALHIYHSRPVIRRYVLKQLRLAQRVFYPH